jgi:hypothetical protein
MSGHRGKVTVTVQLADGTHKARAMDPEDAVGTVRGAVMHLALSAEVVCVTITKSDVITRLMDGRIAR